MPTRAGAGRGAATGFAAVAALVAAAASPAGSAQAASEPYLGEIMVVPYNFCPEGWALAGGQLLSIAQNTALFSLIGTEFGGNGQTTFALPNIPVTFAGAQTVAGNRVVGPLPLRACIAMQGVFPPRP